MPCVCDPLVAALTAVAPSNGSRNSGTASVSRKTMPLTRARRENTTRMSSMMEIGLIANPIADGTRPISTSFIEAPPSRVSLHRRACWPVSSDSMSSSISALSCVLSASCRPADSTSQSSQATQPRTSAFAAATTTAGEWSSRSRKCGLPASNRRARTSSELAVRIDADGGRRLSRQCRASDGKRVGPVLGHDPIERADDPGRSHPPLFLVGELPFSASLHHLTQDVVLAVEVPVDPRVRNAGLGSDVTDADVERVVLGEEALRGIEDARHHLVIESGPTGTSVTGRVLLGAHASTRVTAGGNQLPSDTEASGR